MTDKKTASKKKQTARKRSSRKYTSSAAKAMQRQQEVQHQKMMIGCIIAAVIIVLLLIFALPKINIKKGTLTGVNDDVLQYRSKVEAWCKEFGIEEYSTLMLAMMQQESSGQGTDVFQCSESPFNTMYSNAPNSITDVDYSIQVGVETFAYCLDAAGCKSISDTNRLKVAIQEYNFGNDYAGWALSNYGGYSAENAIEYSEMMKSQLGWSAYGDVEYVPHVLRYIDL